MIDYASFYCGGDSLSNRRDLWNKIIPVGEAISCNASEVFYDKNKIYNIYNANVIELDHFPTYEEINHNYKDQMVNIEEINLIEVETIHGHTFNSKEDIDLTRKKGRFIGNEYVIT